MTVKQTSSSSHKRSPAVQPVTGPEIKRFAPANDRNVESVSTVAKKSSIWMENVLLYFQVDGNKCSLQGNYILVLFLPEMCTVKLILPNGIIPCEIISR